MIMEVRQRLAKLLLTNSAQLLKVWVVAMGNYLNKLGEGPEGPAVQAFNGFTLFWENNTIQ